MVKDFIEFNKLCRKEIKLKDYKGNLDLIYLSVNPHYKKFYVQGINPVKLPYKNTLNEFVVLYKELQHKQITMNKMVDFLQQQDFQSFETYKNILEKKLSKLYRYNTIEKELKLYLPIKRPKKLNKNCIIILDNDELFCYNCADKITKLTHTIVSEVKKQIKEKKIMFVFNKDGKLIDIELKGVDNNSKSIIESIKYTLRNTN